MDLQINMVRICAKKVPHLGTKMILYGNNKMFLRVEAAKEVEKLRREWVADSSICLVNSWIGKYEASVSEKDTESMVQVQA